MKKINTDFSFGELSPKFDGRFDLPYYTKGCSELRNMYVQPQGVASRIAGTDLFSILTTTKDNGIIIPFYFDETRNGLLVFMQAGSSGNLDWFVITDNGRTVSTPVSFQWTAELFDVQWVQIARSSAIILTCPVAKPVIFTWVGGTQALQALTTTGTTFDTAGNYPAACCYFAGRLIFAGSSSNPDKVWASKTLDITNFTAGVNDADSWSTIVTTSDHNKILWVTGKDEGIIVGTSTTETMITGGDNGLTPTALNQKKISQYGSSHADPINIGLSTIFVQSDERRLREIAYTDAEGALVSPDISILAEHLTESGIKRMAYQLAPFEAIFILRNDGNVVMLSYDRTTGINAWCMLDLGCDILDLCTLDNRACFLTRRNGKICVERMKKYDDTHCLFWETKHYYQTVAISDTYATFSIDNGKVKATTTNNHNLLSGWKIMVAKYDDTPIEEYLVEWIDTKNIYIKDLDGEYITELPEGLNVLNGAYMYPVKNSFLILDGNGDPLITDVELDVIADGNKYAGKYTPDNDGEITLPNEAWKVNVGFSFRSHMKTMRIMQEAIGNPVSRINKVYLRLWKSLGCKIGESFEDSEEVTFRDGELDVGTPPLYTGDKEHTLLTGYTNTGYFYVWTDDVYPLNICAMAVDYRSGGQRN